MTRRRSRRSTTPAATGKAAEKKSIFGALTLYLDFINMFQFLLMMFGDRRN